MTKEASPGKAASVKQRLLNISRRTKQNFDLVMRRYALERLLFRLSRTEHKTRLVLKGAMLLYAWRESGFRPTKDLDLLGSGAASPETLREIFQEVCDVDIDDDGLVFDSRSIRIEDIMAARNYAGLCVNISAFLGKARIPIQIDVGFGDVVIPGPRKIAFPSLLGMPQPEIFAYTRESVVAEKVEAMVKLGEANSRIKDYYDIWYLSRNFDFHGALLTEAITATFHRRGTEVPRACPSGLSDEFAASPNHQIQWRAFVKRIGIAGKAGEFGPVVASIRNFILPCLQWARSGTHANGYWPAGGDWRAG